MRLNEKRESKNNSSGVLLALICDSLYRCDIPADAVAHLKAYPELIPEAMMVGVNNISKHLFRKELLPVRQPHATKEEKERLAELIADWFPHQSLVGSTIELLLCDPARIPPLVQRMVLRSMRKAPYRGSQEWANAFERMATDQYFKELNFPLPPRDELWEKEWSTEETAVRRRISGVEAISGLQKPGVKVSNLRGAARYFAKYPAASQAHTIVALGAEWKRGEKIYTLAFSWDRGRTCVNVLPLSTIFGVNCSFLVDVKIAEEKVA